MKEYFVPIKKTTIVVMRVRAKNPHEALTLVREGNGEKIHPHYNDVYFFESYSEVVEGAFFAPESRADADADI